MEYTVENIIKKKEDDIISFLQNNKEYNINSKDKNGNYFIQLLIIKNYYQAFDYIIQNHNNIELDILDNDNRPITYYIIKLDRIKFLDSILLHNT